MDKKNIELNAAIGLGIVLLITALVIFMKDNKNKIPFVKEGQKESARVAPAATPLPMSLAEESEKSIFSEKTVPMENTYEADGKELPVTMLKDLPLDSIPAEKMIPEEKIIEETTAQGVRQRAIKTQPSPEDLKILQQKNVIIY